MHAKKSGEKSKNEEKNAENKKKQVFILNFKTRFMKKLNTDLPPRLELKIKKILILSPSQMELVNAGGGGTEFTKPVSIDCIPPYNAPPYLTLKYCTE